MLRDAKEKFKKFSSFQWFLDPLSKKGPDYIKNKLRILDKINAMDATFTTTNPNSLDFKIKNSFFMPNPCDKSLDNLKLYNVKPINDVFMQLVMEFIEEC